jgi:hypothetical protein
MDRDKIQKDVEFLRRRQHWLEERISLGGAKSYDVREAHALDRVCALVEKAIKITEA